MFYTIYRAIGSTHASTMMAGISVKKDPWRAWDIREKYDNPKFIDSVILQS